MGIPSSRHSGNRHIVRNLPEEPVRLSPIQVIDSQQRLLKRVVVLLSPYSIFSDFLDDIKSVMSQAEHVMEDAERLAAELAASPVFSPGSYVCPTCGLEDCGICHTHDEPLEFCAQCEEEAEDVVDSSSYEEE